MASWNVQVGCLCAVLLALSWTLFPSANAQVETATGLIQFGKFLKDVAYPGLRELLSEHKSWDAFGIPCNYNRKAGFHRFQWKYDGTISCTGLGEWKKSACKSRGCAFKEPMKEYLRALAGRNVATKEQLIHHIQSCDCGFNDGDKQEMINSINQG